MPKTFSDCQRMSQSSVCAGTSEDSKNDARRAYIKYVYGDLVKSIKHHYHETGSPVLYKKIRTLSISRPVKEGSFDVSVEDAEEFLENPLNAKLIADRILKNRRSLDDVIRFLTFFLSHTPRFCDVVGEFQSFSVEDAIEILKPNLICALLADYGRLGSKTYNLRQMMEETNAGLFSPSRISRHPLKAYPETFKSIFEIEKKSNSYEIRTRFPHLLAVILDRQTEIPYWSTEQSRATNWNKNISFLNECLNAIFSDKKFSEYSGTIPDKVKTVDGCVMYYCIERLFRIGTKIRLFLAAAPLEKQAESTQHLLSPTALADFFFSSPLVYIPDQYISKCLHSEEYFHRLIQLSAYWFPVMYYGLHFYLSQRNLTCYRDVLDFLLPFSSDHQKFYGGCTIEHWNKDLTRGTQMYVLYNDKWSKFKPPCGYDSCYAFRTIDNWKEMCLLEDFSDRDRQVIKKIQRILK